MIARCFISTEYAISRLGINYVTVCNLSLVVLRDMNNVRHFQRFVAATIIVVLYVLVFLVLRGSISFSQYRVHSTPGHTIDVLSRERIIIAKRMLWYVQIKWF